MSQTAASVDPAEIERFSAMAAEWWDPQGKFRPLHKFNPVRLAFIRDRIAAHFGRDVTVKAPLSGLRLLDIGCGGGLVAEPMARLGASVLGADAAERNIGVARAHAAESGLGIDYRCTSAEALAAAGERFDVVLTLEVVEHVADLNGFLSSCGQMVKPGGLLIAATLNRTLKAYALAIVGAEYILGWLPRGTHDWKKFVQPHELAQGLRQAGLTMQDVTGVSYDPLADRWSISGDTDVNYMMVAVKNA
ncbi:MAG: bifunctional 2-polyprenyl-6-hydroxyphenol methylase/3-demethylubiquinol 3-O-methyltransferase UbiG [Ferrovibrio sp.]|uniref:bifunctional 2-polyprenyl-6-hydroxyphenol methylase/3-demethylubiquinol 3-O-methyltransferase UbiG n=1 Tax=Ferrovibrio sp. TaxID=1917215 RepID=UPI00391B9192